jgi:hypothetical protein|eukprot:COSAG01_NODE_2024_length_8608_cov_32.124574_12_plen_68_part_00
MIAVLAWPAAASSLATHDRQPVGHRASYALGRWGAVGDAVGGESAPPSGQRPRHSLRRASDGLGGPQ